MRKKRFLKKVICGLTACSIGLATLGLYNCSADDKDYLNNNQYRNRVTQELNANMQVMKNHSEDLANKIVRLKPNDDKKIYVHIGEDISSTVKTNIDKTLSEINNAFKYINDNYYFETCSQSEINKYKKESKTTLDFCYSSLAKDVYGVANVVYKSNSRLFASADKENMYITSGTIYLDKDVFANLIDDAQLYILKHEMSHVLGFADLYSNYDDETSIVNVGITGLSTHLSPNDLKMLYVAYGNKHINLDGSFNQEQMDKVKQLIKAYEKQYYKYLMNNIKKVFWKNNVSFSSYNKSKNDLSKVGDLGCSNDFLDISVNGESLFKEFQEISQDDINGLTFTKNDAKITIKGDSFIYSYAGIEQKGELVLGDDYIILPDILTQSPYDKITTYNDFLTILKINDRIGIYNFDIYHNVNIKEMTIDNSGLDVVVR